MNQFSGKNWEDGCLWMPAGSDVSSMLLLHSESDVPDVLLGGEPLQLWGGGSPPDDPAHPADDGPGGGPWPRGTGKHDMGQTGSLMADVQLKEYLGSETLIDTDKA